MLAEIVFLLLSIPVGLLIAWLTKDELKKRRKWFVFVTVFGLIFSVLSYLAKVEEGIWTFSFLSVVSFVSYMKSLN